MWTHVTLPSSAEVAAKYASAGEVAAPSVAVRTSIFACNESIKSRQALDLRFVKQGLPVTHSAVLSSVSSKCSPA